MTIDQIRQFRFPIYPTAEYFKYEPGSQQGIPPVPPKTYESVDELLSKAGLELFPSNKPGYVRLGQRSKVSNEAWYEWMEVPVSEVLTSHRYLSGLLASIKRKMNPNYGIDEYATY